MNLAPVDPASFALTGRPSGVSPPCYGVILELAFTAPAPAAGGANAIVIEEDSGVLLGTFSPLDYTLAANQVTRRNVDDYVIVTLPESAYLCGVETTLPDEELLELYRVDEAGAAAGAAIAVANGYTGFSREVNLERFALKSREGALDRTQLTAVHLRSYPATARIGVVDPVKGQDVLFFWPQQADLFPPGEKGGAVARAQAVAPIDDALHPEHSHDVGGISQLAYTGYCNVDAGKALENTLARYLGRMPGPFTDEVKFSLVIASDARCMFTFDASDSLNVTYHLLANAFTGLAEPKKVLRFRGDRIGSQEIRFSLPAGIDIRSATVRTVQSLAVADGLAGSEHALSLMSSLASTRGVYLGPGQWVAQAVTPAAAIQATGLAAGMLDITGGTELAVELQDDWQGRPAGKCLAGGKITLAEAGQTRWALLRFATPVILPARRHWLVVKASKGCAVWLTQAGDGDAIQILERRDANDPWQEVSAVMGRAALCRFLVAQADSEPPITLSIDGEAAPFEAGQNEAVTYNLTGGLRHHLAQVAGSTVEIPLTFTAVGAGIVTVYPPEVVYDLSGD